MAIWHRDEVALYERAKDGRFEPGDAEAWQRHVDRCLAELARPHITRQRRAHLQTLLANRRANLARAKAA